MKPEPAEMFSRDWYNEYFRRAEYSAVHSRFCEKVYGKDLCQHGLMDIEELDFLITLIKPRSKILEIGCSNGHITEYIYAHTQSQILGLDFSDVAIKQAQDRTKDRQEALRFTRVDLIQEEIPGSNYDYILLIDSIYFLGELRDAIQRFNQKLSSSGKMLVSFFQTKEDNAEEDLSPQSTDFGAALEDLGFAYKWYDFTENVKRHGILNYLVGEELKDAFEQEGNSFLYEARAVENRSFKESAENNAIFRYLYVIERLDRILSEKTSPENENH
jgi:SAM-dependent methyltransferase